MKQIETSYTFPFGEKVKLVQQQDQTPKRLFVLGVYASAVHARWLNPKGETVISALAVASEPYIFWRGDNAEAIINAIQVPDAVGTLIPASRNLNGPSGYVLDDLYLAPLKCSRVDTWLCDLVPHSCLNPNQKHALARAYEPIMEVCNLPSYTIPPVPKQLTDEIRRQAILDEIRESQSEIIVLLGDEPIKWFINAYDDSRKKLSDFGDTQKTYGRIHTINLDGKDYQILPLVHPRQAGRLGAHSGKWYELHNYWIDNVAHKIKVSTPAIKHSLE